MKKAILFLGVAALLGAATSVRAGTDMVSGQSYNNPPAPPDEAGYWVPPPAPAYYPPPCYYAPPPPYAYYGPGYYGGPVVYGPGIFFGFHGRFR